MAAVGHYSIGEVLTLLQDDFPDVTISKIRFLESQGLIDPERTPSGYRRFFERDLERLRWILVQQRDHYLPLKVIRERLDAGEPFADDASVVAAATVRSGPTTAVSATEPAGLQAGARAEAGLPPPAVGESAGVPAQPPAGAGPAGPAPPSPPPAAEPSAPGPPAPRQPTAAAPPEPTAAGSPPSRQPSAAVPPEPTAAGSPPPRQPTAAAPPQPSTPGPPARAEPSAAGEAAPAGGEAGRGAVPAPPAADGHPSPIRPRDPAPEPVGPPGPGGREAGTAVSLTREELAQAVGCSVDEVDRLARFGLLQGRAAGSARVYGSRDLAVARLACRFAAHGLEARHLRSFRLTAEREMGLFAQVVSPLRLRRDPASHHQAAEAIGDLIALAGELHAVLLARLADEELGPR